MAEKSAFLYRNRCGTYCFQRRIPKKFRDQTKILPPSVRLSLGTPHKPTARKLARMLSVIMDVRAQQYFSSEEAYHRGMKLLQEYVDAHTRFQTFEAIQSGFFDYLDDGDSRLLEKAINFQKSKELESTDLSKKLISDLSNLIDSRLSNIATSAGTSVAPVQGHSIPLKNAFKDFLSNKRSSWKSTGGMEKDYVDVYFPLFLEIVGEISTQELTKVHINQFIKIAQKLPSNRHKHQKYKSLTALDFLNIDIPIEDRLSPITLSKYLSQIGTFLRWLRSNDYTNIELDLPLKNIKVKKARQVDQKSIYTDSDLRKIFNSSHYIQGRHSAASHFWVPLIALFTGARLNEICQLSLVDIYLDKSTNRWIFDINENQEDNPKKSLKRPHHARMIPVHKKLIELGFLDYFESLRKKKEVRLFPELPYVEGANKYGDKIQRWFNRSYLGKNQCNITTPNTSFHSIRHTVITHLVNKKKVDPNRIAHAMGQTPRGGVTQTVYTKKLEIEDYIQYLDLIDFEECFDSKQIRHWSKHLFKS